MILLIHTVTIIANAAVGRLREKQKSRLISQRTLIFVTLQQRFGDIYQTHAILERVDKYRDKDPSAARKSNSVVFWNEVAHYTTKKLSKKSHSMWKQPDVHILVFLLIGLYPEYCSYSYNNLIPTLKTSVNDDQW